MHGMQLTPTQSAIVQRSLAFRAQIARRAAQVVQKPDRTYFIPNGPLWQPKLRPAPPKPERNIEPDYWHLMWFHDLVYGGTAKSAPTRSEGLQPRVEDIMRAVAVEFGVSKLDLVSIRRTANLVTPRQVTAYLAKVLTGKTMPDIGRRMGGRDHTTILYSIRKIEALLLTDIALAARVEKIKASLS